MGGEHSKIAEGTGLDEQDVDRLRQKFDMMRDEQREMTLSQFVSKFPEPQEQLASMIFRAMDVDHSGRIDFREFCVAVAVLSSASDEKRTEFIFSLYDSENKGYVVVGDIKRAVIVFRRSSEAILSSLNPPNGGTGGTKVSNGSFGARNHGEEKTAVSTTSSSSGGGGANPSPKFPAVLRPFSASTSGSRSAKTSSNASPIGATTTGSPSGVVATEPVSEQEAAETIHLLMRPDAQGRVSKAEFERFCQETPEMFNQLEVAFTALKRAAYWDWDNTIDRKDAKECVLM